MPNILVVEDDENLNVGPKIRVWGEPQQAAFVPLVATEALLAT